MTSPLVLVVDDMLETRRLMRRVLERVGITVIEAATGEDGLRQIVARRPALVVLDLRLPGISGLDVARAVRRHADPMVAATLLLACSASVQPEIRAAALAAGCDGFEGKPFDVRTFGAAVSALIATRRPAGAPASDRGAPSRLAMERSVGPAEDVLSES